MSKKKAIAFGVKTAQNPSLFAGLVGTLLEIIMGSCILMIVLSPVFIWMYGFEAIQGYALIIGILIVIGLFIFYEPSNKSNKFKINNRKSEKIKKTYSKKRLCPNCGKEINKKAIRCKYCNYYFKDGSIRAKPNKKRSKSVVSYFYSGVDSTKQNELNNKPNWVRCKICHHGIDVDLGVCEYCGYEIGPMKKFKK